VKSPHRIVDRFLTVLVVISIPVLCASLWRLGASGINQYHELVDRRSMRTLVDSVLAVRADRVVVSGSNAGQTYLEVVDYQCPYCRQTDSLLQQQLPIDRDVRVIALQLPLSSIHPLADGAAIAAVCSARQGVFATFHHMLYSRGIPNQPGGMWRLAAESGAKDSVGFVACLNGSEARQDVEREKEIASRLKVIGTPTFVDVDGNQVPLQRLLNASAGGSK
jgi:protein-disulfide isomerase